MDKYDKDILKQLVKNANSLEGIKRILTTEQVEQSIIRTERRKEKIMNIFFDTEFTGLVPGTSLISIGLIAETGEMFYGEFIDYDISMCDEWIRENVLSNTFWTNYEMTDNQLIKETAMYRKNDIFSNPKLTLVIGTSEEIRNQLHKWLDQFYLVQLVSDVCYYDMVLFCNLFGGAMNIPKNVNPACIDICQLMRISYNENETVAQLMRNNFDMSRECFLKLIGKEIPGRCKHNSLYDALVIKNIFGYYFK